MKKQIDNIIVANPGGIANRIKCLISMWRICDKYDRKLYLNWIRNHTCGAEFDRLFENEFDVVNGEGITKLDNILISETWRFLALPNEVPNNFAKVYPTKKGNNIDFEFDRIPIEVRENILKYLNKLIPIKVIRNIVDDFSNTYNVSNLVGVHIRRDDFVMCGNKKNSHVASDELFISKMNELIQKDNTTMFLLCTDSQETEDKFKELFKEKIIIYPKKNRNRATRLNTQQGLVDLLLLSKTKHIIGTYCSTYNELAWWFGGCKAKVDIILDQKLKEEFLEKDQKLNNSKLLKLKKYFFNKLRLFKKTKMKGGLKIK